MVKDENFSSAELIFGQTLRLPGQFFNDYEISLTQSEYRKQLIVSQTYTLFCKLFLITWIFLNRVHLELFHSINRLHIMISIHFLMCFILRQDCVQRPLQKLYTNPHKVLQRFPKTFIIEFRGSKSNVFPLCISKERLEPAYLGNCGPLTSNCSRKQEEVLLESAKFSTTQEEIFN